ncbi:MAG: CBS domain-containing protein [Blastocatellia bacterium]|nr:CBS domain-containing protein [Blastocatellia bacterium]
MRTVKHLLEGKSSNTWTIDPSATVFEALTMMAQKEVGALCVTENEKLVGILSERDYARKVILKGKTSRETLVGEIMTGDVITVRPEQSIDECMTLMTDKRLRHLPVVVDEKLVGIISIGDVVKDVISEQQHHIKQLEMYISA